MIRLEIWEAEASTLASLHQVDHYPGSDAEPLLEARCMPLKVQSNVSTAASRRWSVE